MKKFTKSKVEMSEYSDIEIKLSDKDHKELLLIAEGNGITLNQLLSDTLSTTVIKMQEESITKLKKQVTNLKKRLKALS